MSLTPILGQCLRRLGMRQPKLKAQAFLYFMLTPIAWIYCRVKKLSDVWMIDERLSSSAQDNGSVFFNYMQDHHQDIQCFFILDPRSKFWPMLKSQRRIVRQGSLRHLCLLHAATVLMSTDRFHSLSPPTVLVKKEAQKRLNVFLQHGVAGNKTVNYGKSQHPYFNLVITSNQIEANAFRTVYGFGESEIALTGLPRFDLLPQNHDRQSVKKILIAPTWRRWLKASTEFTQSTYATNWLELLSALEKTVSETKNDVELIFCPHFNMYRHLGHFTNLGSAVSVLDMRETDVTKLIASSDLLITDYSSIMYDFFVQRKPVIGFMFDREEWEAQKPGPPHVDFGRDLPMFLERQVDAVLARFNKLLNDTDLDLDLSFANRYKKVISHYDKCNCSRIFTSVQRKLDERRTPPEKGL